MNKNNLRKLLRNNYCWMYYILIYILLFIECLFSVQSLSFTRDGGFTFGIVHKSFFGIIKMTSLDVHPFLYYFIAKLFISPFHNITYQIVSLRILSALPYLILFIISNTLIRHRFGNKVSLIFMFLILMMPVVNNYVFILRMYSLSMLFITCTFFLFIYVYKGYLHNSLKSFILISIFSLLASYSHYYSLLVSIIMYVIFLIIFLHNGRKIKYMIYSIIIDVILYSPWMLVLMKQFTGVKHGFWNTPITFTNVLTSVINLACPLHGKLIHIIPIFLIISIIFIFINYHEYNNIIILTGFIIGVSTILISIIISIVVHHSVLQSRYLVPIMGIIWFSVVLLLMDTHINVIIRRIMLILLLIVGALSYSSNLLQLHKDSTQYDNTVESIKDISKKSTIIYNGNLPNYISSYHLSKNVYLTNNHLNLYNKSTKVYCKVYNLTSTKNVDFKLSKGSYFIAPVKKDSLGNRFYFHHKMRNVKYVYLPNDSGSKVLKCILYKIV